MTRPVSLAFKRHNIRLARVCVTVVTDDEIAALNTQYLGHDGPTDVLSFDLGGPRSGAVQTPTCAGPDEHADGGKTIEGDIVVSLGTAAREARTRGHSLADELALYAVHGTLHLLGYDDRRPADARRMHEVEDELLMAAGIGRIYGVRSE